MKFLVEMKSYVVKPSENRKRNVHAMTYLITAIIIYLMFPKPTSTINPVVALQLILLLCFVVSYRKGLKQTATLTYAVMFQEDKITVSFQDNQITHIPNSKVTGFKFSSELDEVTFYLGDVHSVMMIRERKE